MKMLYILSSIISFNVKEHLFYNIKDGLLYIIFNDTFNNIFHYSYTNLNDGYIKKQTISYEEFKKMSGGYSASKLISIAEKENNSHLFIYTEEMTEKINEKLFELIINKI